MQTKRKSLVESTVNTVLGLVTSFLIQVVIYPILDIPVSINQNILITIVFVFASLIRGYLVRRIFNNLN
jgi:hypothetical protein